MNKILLIIWTILFLIAVVKIELYFLYKSREKFLELKKVYKELKKSKEDLYNLLKDKRLQ